MLFTYDKTTKKIGRYNTTDFKVHDILERRDLEKWIEDNPEILGEDLIVITTEYDKFDKTDERLDILALDQQGNVVVVELKRDDSGKNVDLQAIKYAAYCSTLTFDEIVEEHQEYLSKKGLVVTREAARERLMKFVSDEFEELSDKPRIILVSKEFRQEVTASVLWLRKFGLDIRCVKLTPYEFNKTTIAFESSILIPLPEAGDFIIKAEKKDNVEHSLTVTQQEYMAFYKGIISEFKTLLPIPLGEPRSGSYYQIPTGITGIHFEWAFHGRPRSSFGVELHFEKGNQAVNAALLIKIEHLKGEIEKQTGEPVFFEKEWGRTWPKMYIEKTGGAITEELRKWAVSNMIIFYRLLLPELQKTANE